MEPSSLPSHLTQALAAFGWMEGGRWVPQWSNPKSQEAVPSPHCTVRSARPVELTFPWGVGRGTEQCT